MRFANAAALQLLWILPLFAVLALVLERRVRARLKKAFGGKTAPFLSQSVSPTKRHVKLVFRLLALAGFIVALARPQFGESKQEVKARGVELMIAVDVSNSMLAEDVKPSRLDNAKAELMKLLDMMAGDRAGLIAFAGSPAVLSPLTSDLNSLKMYVEGLSPESVGNQGTNFKSMMDEAKSAFDHGGIDSDEQTHVTKVLLVISDGEDQEEGALDKARELADDGMRIFTIAFGTERGAPIPMRDERGFLSGYKRDSRGQNVMSKVNVDFLRQIAQTGRGSFHHASAGGMEARAVKEDIDKLEKKEFSSTLETSYDERYQIPLLFGLIFALLDFAIGERIGSGRRLWRGRFEVAAK